MESLSPLAVSGIVILVTAAYFMLTARIVRRKPFRLWIPALAVALGSTLLYWSAYTLTGLSDGFPKLVLSVKCSLDLFLFNITSAIGRFTDFFYGQTGADGLVTKAPGRIHLIVLQGLFLCSIWTTSILVVHFFLRRAGSRILLAWKRWTSCRKGVNLFIQITPEAVSVAESMQDGKPVWFVDIPDMDNLPAKVSFMELLKGIRQTNPSTEVLRRSLPDATVLKARKPVRNGFGAEFLQDLGLSGLKRWLSRPDTVVFLLSDDYGSNLDMLHRLEGFPAQIYCRADRSRLAERQELTFGSHVHLVDSAYLSVRYLRTRDDLYPVRLVDIARDEAGNPKGYVSSPFNAMICGFGESGQGALSFLYEFGAFAGMDRKASPFHCDVLDGDIDGLAGVYLLNHPGLDTKRVSFVRKEIGSQTFWAHVRNRIDVLNYIFISLEDDSRSVSLALDLLELAFQSGRDDRHFRIVLRLDRPEACRELLRFYDSQLGKGHSLSVIGDRQDIWTWKTLSDGPYQDAAQVFYNAYAAASGEETSWNGRRERVRQKDESLLARSLEIRRKESQDLSNYFHARVKTALCPPCFLKDSRIADGILFDERTGGHCTGLSPEEEACLDYLAVGEHLRWVASHEVAGYRRGEETREDLKLHAYLADYQELPERIKHYDWTVVKTTLQLAGASTGPKR